MNTADKSIALIDAALRRRFTFIEYTADASYLKQTPDGIDLNKMLLKLNSRLEYLLDTDHLLGHAYFMGVDSKDKLCAVFRNKILPLLQEYFFNDFQKIQLVLGDNAEWKKDHSLRLIDKVAQFKHKDFFGKQLDDYDGKELYAVSENLRCEKYDKIPVEVFTSIYDNSIKPQPVVE